MQNYHKKLKGLITVLIPLFLVTRKISPQF